MTAPTADPFEPWADPFEARRVSELLIRSIQTGTPHPDLIRLTALTLEQSYEATETVLTWVVKDLWYWFGRRSSRKLPDP